MFLIRICNISPYFTNSTTLIDQYWIKRVNEKIPINQMSIYILFGTDKKQQQNSIVICLKDHQNCLACSSLVFISIIAPVSTDNMEINVLHLLGGRQNLNLWNIFFFSGNSGAKTQFIFVGVLLTVSIKMTLAHLRYICSSQKLQNIQNNLASLIFVY